MSFYVDRLFTRDVLVVFPGSRGKHTYINKAAVSSVRKLLLVRSKFENNLICLESKKKM